MIRWSKDELEDALQHLFTVTDYAFASGDLTDWYQCYTDNVVWHDLGFGFNDGWDYEIRGLEAVRSWMEGHNAIYPHSAMKYWPVVWYTIDEEHGRAVCEWRNRMRDPGTGEVFEEMTFSYFAYAGGRKWSYEMDIYNPIRMRMMMAHWKRAREQIATREIELPPIDMEWGKHIAPEPYQHTFPCDKDELEAAFVSYLTNVRRAFVEGKPEILAESFSDDVTYRDLGFGFDGGWGDEMKGNVAVANWLRLMSCQEPHRYIQSHLTNWHVADPARGWVLFESLNQMHDVTSDVSFQTRSVSRMIYAGSNKWSFKEEVYNPLAMRHMMARWRGRARARAQ